MNTISDKKDKTIKRKKFFALFLLLLAIFSGGYYLFKNENVRRGTAIILKQEYIPNQNIDITQTIAFQKQDSLYSLWAKNFRFHTQGFFEACLSDSSRLLIFSEPPPHITIDSVRSIFAKFNIYDSLRSRKIGVDGFGKDIQIIIARASNQNLKRLGEQLSQYFYGTGYKSGFEPIQGDYRKIYFAKDDLNYFINLDELNSWFLENNELFLLGDDTLETTTVPVILDKKQRGVFFSKEAGFVIWSLPKGSDLIDKTADIRKFTLDADLILGAISDDSTLVIIGRERVSPINELPPLRIETIRLLASISKKELSQSLDINDLLAGKMEDGKDWCPTFLTPELENTELGDLLTITDILLKDWSESGTIREAYYSYPEPGYYPFRKPLFRLLGLNELVYNWNTADVMYAIDIKGSRVVLTNSSDSGVTSEQGAGGVAPEQSVGSVGSVGGVAPEQSVGSVGSVVPEHSVGSVAPEQSVGGVGSVGSSNGGVTRTVYAIDRTGSLPVSYFNSQQSHRSIGWSYENTAYNYFSSLGCTDLVRVVQYVAIYQLFSDNGIHFSGNTFPAIPQGKQSLLSKPVKVLLSCVRDNSAAALRIVADSLAIEQFENFVRRDMKRQLSQNEESHHFKYSKDQLEFIEKDVFKRISDDNFNRLERVKSIVGSLSDEDFNKLCRYLASPRAFGYSSKNHSTFYRGMEIQKIFRQLSNNVYRYFGLSVNKLKNSYVGALSKVSSPYLKSASAVVTFNDMLTTGGHNISSKITKVNRMKGYRHRNYSGGEIPRYAAPSGGEVPAAGEQPNSGGAPTNAGGQPKVMTNAGGQPNSGGGAPTNAGGQPSVMTNAGGQPNSSGGAPTNAGGQPNSSGKPINAGGQPSVVKQPNSGGVPTNASRQPNSTTAKQTSVATATTFAAKPTVRPRTSVIPATARSHRGL
ncbi:MAG: hypothetical protein LBQ31_09360 [Bacteroidales bacterium]|nr:hypothetical protein [Bacteroidales bacterium]